MSNATDEQPTNDSVSIDADCSKAEEETMNLCARAYDLAVLVAHDCLRVSVKSPAGETIVELAYNEVPPKLMEAIIDKIDAELDQEEQLLRIVKKMSRVPRKESTTPAAEEDAPT